MLITSFCKCWFHLILNADNIILRHAAHLGPTNYAMYSCQDKSKRSSQEFKEGGGESGKSSNLTMDRTAGDPSKHSGKAASLYQSSGHVLLSGGRRLSSSGVGLG